MFEALLNNDNKSKKYQIHCRHCCGGWLHIETASDLYNNNDIRGIRRHTRQQCDYEQLAVTIIVIRAIVIGLLARCLYYFTTNM